MEVVQIVRKRKLDIIDVKTQVLGLFHGVDGDVEIEEDEESESGYEVYNISPSNVNTAWICCYLGSKNGVYQFLHLSAGLSFRPEWYDDYDISQVQESVDAVRDGRIEEDCYYWKESFYGADGIMASPSGQIPFRYRIGIIEPLLGRWFGPSETKHLKYEPW